MIFVYPADYFDAARADDLFEIERQIATQRYQDVVLFDFDSGKPIHGTTSMNSSDCVIYRGWQMPPEKYREVLYPLMQEYGRPLVSLDAYENGSLATRYAEYIGAYMLPCISVPYCDIDENVLLSVFAELDADKLFVKDDMKSVMNQTAIYKERIREAEELISNIQESRGYNFTGNIIFKPWVNINNQVRAFIYNGKPILLVPHDGIWDGTVPPHIPCNVPSPFYTLDMGQIADGTWVVVECGDGQVSDIGTEIEIEILYDKLIQGK